MNAIELLESLLRGGASGGQNPAGPSQAGQILRDILQGGGQARAENPAPSPDRNPAPSRTQPDRPASLPPVTTGAWTGPVQESEKANVQDLIHAAEERAAGRPVRPAAVPTRRTPSAEPPPRRSPQPATTPPRVPAAAAPPREDEAGCLIRAMINAVRADGQMDSDEEQKILRHLGQPKPDVVAFIRAEFQKPLDVREFTWSVPRGLEEKIYAISLSVIELDHRDESTYLKDLAHGLRLDPDVCAGLHQRFGAPLIP